MGYIPKDYHVIEQPKGNFIVVTDIEYLLYYHVHCKLHTAKSREMCELVKTKMTNEKEFEQMVNVVVA
jgi:hypothetical protein